MKIQFETISALSDFLNRGKFSCPIRGTCIFNDGTFSFPDDKRRKSVGKMNRYTLFQYESAFMFRTFENELHPAANEFLIYFEGSKTEGYSIVFRSMPEKLDVLALKIA